MTRAGVSLGARGEGRGDAVSKEFDFAVVARKEGCTSRFPSLGRVRDTAA